MKKNATKSLLLPIILLIALLALPVGVQADGGTDENGLTQTVNGYEVTLVFEKPAAVGENKIRVFVKDAMSMPVSQADLEVSLVEAETEHTEQEPESEAGTMSTYAEQPTAEAETMSGMSSMEAQPTAEIGTMSSMSEQPAEHDQMGMVALAAGHESGEYEGEITIASDGDQTIRIHLTVDGKLTEVDFPLHVVKSNTGVVILGSFFAVNVALIAAAVVMKPKPVSINLSKKA